MKTDSYLLNRLLWGKVSRSQVFYKTRSRGITQKYLKRQVKQNSQDSKSTETSRDFGLVTDVEIQRNRNLPLRSKIPKICNSEVERRKRKSISKRRQSDFPSVPLKGLPNSLHVPSPPSSDTRRRGRTPGRHQVTSRQIKDCKYRTESTRTVACSVTSSLVNPVLIFSYDILNFMFFVF